MAPPAAISAPVAPALAPADPLVGVDDPWAWPRAAGATDRERAIEDLGPDIDDLGHFVNSNADCWTRLVGLAWTRDVNIDFDREPVDLDGDGRPDATVTRHIHAPGGILGNPATFGLTATPDDPPGRDGRISRSTGYLGLREALTRDGRPTGQIGMTCFLCHGAARAGGPGAGAPWLGLAATSFDYGLLLATAAVLDDDDAVAAAYRRAHGFPSGRTVRARLLLAGPGRQDLTGEFGLDVTVPGLHSTRYAGTARLRQGTVGIVNPISVPSAWGTEALDVQNWSGSEIARASWLSRVLDLGGATLAARSATLAALGLPAPRGADGDPGVPNEDDGERPARRALLLDLRNLGTLGLQQDSDPALRWTDAVRGRVTLSPGALRAIPALYATAAVRRVLAAEARAWRGGSGGGGGGGGGGAAATAGEPDTRATGAAAIARGRALFAERVVGRIANLQVLGEPPAAYAAARLTGPTLAPIDAALASTIPVRCADCHSAMPGGPRVSLDAAPPPFGRCSHCHRSHAPFDGAGAGGRPDGDEPRRPLAALGVPASAEGEVSRCRECHARHRAFVPGPDSSLPYSSGLVLPFDANLNGMAQDDEVADQAAGGIGTEALLAFDVPRPARPPGGFQVALAHLSDARRAGRVATTRLGAGWVRVAPLGAIGATAPYLHNGSVPTLAALFEPAARRPVVFARGHAGFVLDTRLPGNRNLGHEFGTELSSAEKRDLVAFLESL